jgi:hypothetical protein
MRSCMASWPRRVIRERVNEQDTGAKTQHLKDWAIMREIVDAVKPPFRMQPIGQPAKCSNMCALSSLTNCISTASAGRSWLPMVGVYVLAQCVENATMTRDRMRRQTQRRHAGALRAFSDSPCRRPSHRA